MVEGHGDEERGADVVGRHKRLGARTILISSFTLVSRLLGYAREFLAAVLFGDTSPIYDAFVTAWRVPNLFRRLLGEGAVATSLQTALTEADSDRGNEAGRRLLWDTLRLALLILLGLCALVMGAALLMGDTMPITGWRWLGPDPAPVRELMVRLTPFVVLVCLTGLAGGALAVRGRFAGASAGPAVMNLVVIASLVGLGAAFGWTGLDPSDGAEGRERHLEMARVLAWGMLAAGLAQLLMLLPEMRAAGFLRRARVAKEARVADTGWTVLRASLPLALGAAVYQINVMVDGFMAQALLPRGGPTTYYFANRIQQLPLALIATAATSAVFPALKAFGHERRFGELRRLHDRTQLMVLFVGLPATVGLFVLAEPVVTVLLGHGEFGAEGIERTSRALSVLCFSLLPAGAVGLAGRTYYAIGDFRTPVVISIGMLGLNLALNVVFLVVLGLDVEGLALATAISSWGNLALLLPGLTRRLPGASGERVGASIARIAGAAAASGLAALGTHLALGGEPASPAHLVAAILCGVVVYALAARVLGVPQWALFRARFRRRADRSDAGR
ncbi:MAG: murein biosynthesis integral membrane protein MurJ [bacterium]|nr:murein biosynthesis integral membrane protein MurJ [bacterium]